MRLKNCYVENDKFINGQVMKAVGLTETLERAGKEIGWGTPKPPASGPLRRGRGIATTLKGTATPTESQCIIIVAMDGSVTLLTSAVEVGAGQHTALAQIAAETIGVDPIHDQGAELRHVQHPLPISAPPRAASPSTTETPSAGRGKRPASRILEIAGEVLKTDPARLSLVNGKIVEEGVGEGPRSRRCLPRNSPAAG